MPGPDTVVQAVAVAAVTVPARVAERLPDTVRSGPASTVGGVVVVVPPMVR
nr:hypothetical protein GCM10020063_065670 [Dactylosporangium thailandense]